MKKQSLPSVDTIPPDILKILGPPPLLSTEDEGIYYAMILWFAKDIPPTDLIAWLLIKDLVDYRFEIGRYRRMKAAIVEEGQRQRAHRSLRREIDRREDRIEEQAKQRDVELRRAECMRPYDEEKVAEQKAKIEARFQEGLALTEKVFNATVNTLNVDPEEKDYAIALPHWIEDYEKVEQLLQSAERNFLRTLREIERHIFGFAKALREGLTIIEGEVLGKTEHDAAAPRRELNSTKSIARSDPRSGMQRGVRNGGT